MPAFPVSSIAAFLHGEAKQIRRGENSFNSNRVEMFLFNAGAAHISAKVGASMKNRTCSVEVSVSVNGLLQDGAFNSELTALQYAD